MILFPHDQRDNDGGAHCSRPGAGQHRRYLPVRVPLLMRGQGLTFLQSNCRGAKPAPAFSHCRSRDLSSLGAQRAWLGGRSSLTAKPDHDKFSHEGVTTLGPGRGAVTGCLGPQFKRVHQSSFQAIADVTPVLHLDHPAVVADEGDHSERAENAVHESQGFGSTHDH